MRYDVEEYGVMQWEVEKTVKTMFKVATYVCNRL